MKKLSREETFAFVAEMRKSFFREILYNMKFAKYLNTSITNFNFHFKELACTIFAISLLRKKIEKIDYLLGFIIIQSITLILIEGLSIVPMSLLWPVALDLLKEAVSYLRFLLEARNWSRNHNKHGY